MEAETGGYHEATAALVPATHRPASRIDGQQTSTARSPTTRLTRASRIEVRLPSTVRVKHLQPWHCQVVRAISRQGVEQVRAHARAFSPRLRCDSERRRLRNRVPFPPALAHHHAIVGRRQRMAAGTKLIAHRAEHGTEARRVPEALESLQIALTLPDRLVRVLDAVVLAPAAKMGHARHHHTFRRRVAREPGALSFVP